MEHNDFKSNDLSELLKTYTKHWKWFFISVTFAVILALVYIRYATTEYAIEAKIKILEDKSASSELSLFEDLNFLAGKSNNLEDELQILKSRSNLMDVVKEFGLNTKIIALGTIKNSEVYDNKPFKINFITADSIIRSLDFEFFFTFSSETTFGYAEVEDAPEKVYSFGKNIATPIGDIIITPTAEEFSVVKGRKYQVQIRPVARVADELQEIIFISPTGDASNIVSISMNDAIPKRAEDILRVLIRRYNENGVEDKKIVADRTSDFINNRITTISSSLSTVDESAQEFKTERGITDIASEANINLNIGASNQQELQNTSVQLDIASSMKDYISDQSGYDVLPSNIGLADAAVVNTTTRYNELVAERNRLLKSSNEKNPIVVNLDQELDGLKRTLQSSLNGMTNNLELRVNNLSSQQAQINSRIYSVPKNERALRDITRKQQTTEALYLYLLQKREEAQIAYASATPKSKLVDMPYTSQFPVSPKIPVILLASVILGLLLPFSMIYANDLLDNKVHNKVGLEKIVKDAPVLAELPKLTKKDNVLIIKDDRSVLAESLRILRTNLDYLINVKKTNGKGNIIFVTSSVPGEGKTFLSSNLAMIFASTNKKVLLIGADIRAPKLYSFFTGKNVDNIGGVRDKETKGLTEYLYDKSLASKDIINSMLVYTNTIDVIYSGKIPPNPAELIMSKRLEELFSEMSQKYDYVIVDTAPLLVVTDTLLISGYADQIIYVTRAGVTENKILEFPLKLKQEGKLNGLSFVVNGVKETNLGYGGKYGYGYGRTTKKWWKFN